MNSQISHQRLRGVVLNRLQKGNFWVDCAKHYKRVMEEGASSDIKIETLSHSEETREHPRQDASHS